MAGFAGEIKGQRADHLLHGPCAHDLELCHLFPHARRPRPLRRPAVSSRERGLQKFKDLIAGNELIVAPVALNPIMARLAKEAGFKALYLSGGSLGWVKCVTEANLSLW